jgi:hypothetical protein
MQTVQKNRKTESVISIVLILALAAIFILILIKQKNYNLSRFGTTGENTAPKAQTSQTAGKEISIFEPVNIDGFAKSGNTAVFDKENLYEKIDGKADLYFECGFEKLFNQLYENLQDKSPQFEIYLYDMGSAKNAFSIYSMQKRPDVTDLKELGFAYNTTNSLYLISGKYYAEFVGFAQSQQLIDAMKAAAAKLIESLGQKDSKILELEYFPTDGLISASFRSYLTNAFGCESLKDVFAADYTVDGKKITAFLSISKDVTVAADTVSKYKAFLKENGAEAQKALNPKLEAAVFDFGGVTEIILAVDNIVIGIHEADSSQAAQKLIEKFIEKLKQKEQHK